MANSPVTQYADCNTLVGVNNNQEEVTGDAAIINTLLNVILVQRRSRKWRSDFGSHTHYFLQQPVNANMANQLRVSLLQDLTRWQPYAKITLSGIHLVPNNNGTGYNLAITYASQLSGSKSTLVTQLSVQSTGAS